MHVSADSHGKQNKHTQLLESFFLQGNVHPSKNTSIYH